VAGAGPSPATANRVTPAAARPKQGKRIKREAQPSFLGSESFELPPLHLLTAPKVSGRPTAMSADALEQNARILEGVLEDFGLRGDLQSDAACVFELTKALMNFAGLRFMRDPTRGGIATVAHEILRATGFGVRFEATIPVRDQVQSVCEMLGYDPYYLACEGRVLAIIAEDQADAALAAWRTFPSGQDAARIGRIVASEKRVILETALGGERFLEELEDDPLPRIC